MEISVVIPTFNRAEILKRTLSGLARQSGDLSYEVLVVDDGSTDHTAELVYRFQENYPVALDYFYQPNRKQGAARNLGSHHARGRLIVFLGDDIVPAPDFLAAHCAVHRNPPVKAPIETIVSIGYTTWPQEVRTTRFLRFIGEQGWQFGYSLITNPHDLAFNFFYTSNLMISRDFFLGSGGFDEDFREYGWEDIELSFRLKQQGMALLYVPDARAWHFHELNFQRFVERQHKVGQAAWSLYRKHPELADFLGIENRPRYSQFDHLKLRTATLFCRLTEKLDWLDLTGIYPDLMTYHYLCGLAEAAPEPVNRTNA